jgi:hypothetical protein
VHPIDALTATCCHAQLLDTTVVVAGVLLDHTVVLKMYNDEALMRNVLLPFTTTALLLLDSRTVVLLPSTAERTVVSAALLSAYETPLTCSRELFARNVVWFTVHVDRGPSTVVLTIREEGTTHSARHRVLMLMDPVALL